MAKKPRFKSEREAFKAYTTINFDKHGNPVLGLAKRRRKR